MSGHAPLIQADSVLNSSTHSKLSYNPTVTQDTKQPNIDQDSVNLLSAVTNKHQQQHTGTVSHSLVMDALHTR